MHDITLADSIAEETDGSSEHWAGAALAKASATELGVLGRQPHTSSAKQTQDQFSFSPKPF